MPVKVKIEIPKWAEWKKKPTILDKIHSLVDELPKGFMFYPELIHNQVINDSQFTNTKFRRTHEALYVLQGEGILKHDKDDRNFFASINGNKVKLYKVI